jgi:phenylacetate-coenzyme A ligase PaaK-like adenylate-forming protein
MESRYWNPVTETMPRAELRAWQWRKLQAALAHARRGSPFWRERLPADIDSLEAFAARVPLLRRQDIVDAEKLAPPYGTMASCDPRLAIRHHQTSGSTGYAPVRTFDTMRDWTWATDMWCTALWAMGVRPNHKAMVAFGYGLFIGFWGLHYALERLGATLVPAGSMDSQARVKLLLDQGIEFVGCTPTYAMRLVMTAREMGIDLARDGNVKIVIAAAECRPDSTRRALVEAFGAPVYDVAGMTEIATIFYFECPERVGCCHIVETDVIEEVLHPETGAPVGYGEQGVRVATNLGREGFQIFRYWTDDLVIKQPFDQCTCGRTWDWYDHGILGRRDEMKKIRGVSVTPVMIEDVVRRSPEVFEFQAALRTVRGLDTVVVRVEPRPDVSQSEHDRLCERIATEMKREIGLRPEVEIAAQGSLPRFEVKAKRFHDER